LRIGITVTAGQHLWLAPRTGRGLGAMVGDSRLGTLGRGAGGGARLPRGPSPSSPAGSAAQPGWQRSGRPAGRGRARLSRGARRPGARARALANPIIHPIHYGTRSGKGGVEVLQHAHDVLALAWRPDGKLLRAPRWTARSTSGTRWRPSCRRAPARSAPAAARSAPAGSSPSRARPRRMRLAWRAARRRRRAPDARARPRSSGRGRVRSMSGGRPAADAAARA